MGKIGFIVLASAMALFAADSLPVTHVKGDLHKLSAVEASKKVKFTELWLYPQTAIENNDQKATYNFLDTKARAANVGILMSDSEMSVVVKFKISEPRSQKFDPTSFADGVAIQFPQHCSAPDKLPYIGMGSDGRPVSVFLQKNNNALYPVARPVDMTLAPQSINEFGKDLKSYENKETSYAHKYQKVFVSEGFRSLTEVKDAKVKMDLVLNKDTYTAVFTRSLNDGLAQTCDILPISVAVWVGADNSRDGMKWLSKWTPIEIKNTPQARADVAMIDWQAKGDIKKGEELAKDLCSSCHTMGRINASAPYMGPNLTNIGGYSTGMYIKESITHPNAAVVPGYNANAHARWYALNGEGKRESVMPSFDGMLTPEQLDDIVAFLQTLKASKPK